MTAMAPWTMLRWTKAFHCPSQYTAQASAVATKKVTSGSASPARGAGSFTASSYGSKTRSWGSAGKGRVGWGGGRARGPGGGLGGGAGRALGGGGVDGAGALDLGQQALELTHDVRDRLTAGAELVEG